MNRLSEYAQLERGNVGRCGQATESYFENLDRSTINPGGLQSESYDPSGVLQILDGNHHHLDTFQLPPLSPSLISFVASDASCHPHDLDEAHWQRIGEAASRNGQGT